jgi:hypothetical protein
VLSGLFVNRVLVALGAMLLNLEAVGIVAAVLARDVITVLALLAGEGDLGTDVVAGHSRAFP